MRGLAAAVLLALLLASADAQTSCTGNPTAISNSAWNPTCSGTLVGQNCTRLCNKGYWSKIPVSSLCQANGLFAAPAGKCQKACGSVPTTTAFPIDGTWPSSCNNKIISNFCTATCAFGTATVQCIDNGVGGTMWGNPTGACSNTPVCGTVPVLFVNNAQKFPASCLNTPVNGTCAAPCNQGYNSNPTAPTLTCKQVNATFADWDYAGISPSECGKFCGPLPPSVLTLNANWSCNSIGLGSSCLSNCAAGFIPDPSAPAITCSSTGTWDLTTLTGACRVDPGLSGPVCRSRPTTTPFNTPGFPASCVNQPVNATCSAPCNSNLNANPTLPTVVCRQINATDGAWDTVASPSGCAAVCPALPPSILALNATWSCTATGAGQACTATACTNGQVPLPSLPSLKCALVNNVYTWDTSSLTGACVPNPGPRCSTAPPNSITISNARPWPASCVNTLAGSACEGQCNTGYAGVNPTIQCVADSTSATGGSWATVANGTCVKACIGSPPANLLTNGGVWPDTCTNAPVGAVCRANCTFGTATITCSGAGTWDTFTGQCTSSPVCTTVPGPWPTNSKNYPSSCINTPVGGTCSAPCNDGYNSAEPTLTCVQQNATFADWNQPATPALCTRVCGALPPSVLNGYNATWSCSQAQQSSTCTATCASGFVPAPTPPSLQCQPVSGGLPAWNLATLTGNCIPDPGPTAFTTGCTGVPSAQPVTNGRPFTIACDNTVVGSACIGTCNPGYGGQPQIQVQCLASNTSPTGGVFNTTAEGVCRPVCQGAPPASLLGGLGTWPTSCTNNVSPGGFCSAQCNGGPNFGGATIECTGSGWDAATYTGRCSATEACNGAPPSVTDLSSWPSSCTSADKGTVCYGTCRSGFTADDPPRSTCVFNGTTTFWSTPVPSACSSGTTRLPRAFLVDPTANEVVICNDNNGQLQRCERNTGAFGPVPAFNGPVGIDVKGEQVWISQANPPRVRVCDWYSRQLTSCRNPSSFGLTGLSGGAGQVALSDDRQRAYVAATYDDAIVYCNNTQLMTDCDAIEVSDSPVGLDVGLDQLWYGDKAGVMRCPLTDLIVDNSTCVNTTMGGQVNGVWVDSVARKLYLAQTALGRVMLCDITQALDVTNCVATPIPKGPGSIGLDTFNSRLYVPLSNAGSSELTVCTAGAQSCATSTYTLNPPRTTSGNANIAHAMPPVIPGVTAAEAQM